MLILTPDCTPIVYVKSSGEKNRLFHECGSYSTEQLGRLLDQLETEHQVYRYANCDPMDMNGFSYMLSLGRGEEPGLVMAEDVESILRERGEALGEKDETLLVIIGKVWISNPRSLRKIEPRRGLPGVAALVSFGR